MIRLNICIFCSLLSSAVIAEDQEITSTYKCYIETSYGNDLAMFTWYPSKQVQGQASILTQKVGTVSGKRAVVRGIEECVLTGDIFKSKDAQKMDEEISTY